MDGVAVFAVGEDRDAEAGFGEVDEAVARDFVAREVLQCGGVCWTFDDANRDGVEEVRHTTTIYASHPTPAATARAR